MGRILANYAWYIAMHSMPYPSAGLRGRFSARLAIAAKPRKVVEFELLTSCARTGFGVIIEMSHLFNLRNEERGATLMFCWKTTQTTMDHATEDVPPERRSIGIDPGITEYRPTSPRIRVQPERRWLRVAVLTALAVILALILYDALTEQRVKEASVGFVGWVEEHPFLGVLAVILAYILATILFVPASVLTLGTGFAFRSAFNSIGKGVALASTVSCRSDQIIQINRSRYSFTHPRHHHYNLLGRIYRSLFGIDLYLSAREVSIS
jgi:hypothetical protein